ncbi:hypothetical protein CY35_01G056300 [Sphagnum magellanicum]|nr:hypothetical protein CY35_01G056300 [Sphagnum magellanicum]
MGDWKGSRDGRSSSERAWSLSRYTSDTGLTTLKNGGGRLEGLVGSSMPGSSSTARKRSEQWMWSCCCLMGGFLMLLLLFTCIGVVLWLVFRPHSPEFSLQALNITSLTVKQMAQSGKTLNSSSALLSMNSTLVFSAVNTNQFRVTYSAMVVNATYQDVAVGHTLVPAFGQEAHSNVSVPTLLIMDKVSLVRPTGADLLEDATNDQFPLYLTGRMDTCVHTFGFKSPSIHIELRCVIVLRYHELKLASKQCGTNVVHS